MDYLCTDKLRTYRSYRYDSNPETRNKRYIPKKQLSKRLVRKIELEQDLKQFSIHIRSKSETCPIESVNNRIRHYLARFRRKTLSMSKSIEMMEHSLYLLFDKLYWGWVVR